MNLSLRISFIVVLIGYLGITLSSAQSPTPKPTIKPALKNDFPKVKDTTTSNKAPKSFLDVLKARLAKSDLTVEKFCPQNKISNRRILNDYGAIFVGEGEYYSPCYFSDENRLQEVQRELLDGAGPQVVGGVRIELQPAAMKALLKAVAEAKSQGLEITPRGGSMAARRSFADTVRLWSTRVNPGLDYWMKKGRLSAKEVKQIRAMPVSQQVDVILNLEENKGLYFSTDFSKSILYSVAMPGGSQHNWMLALDVAQFSEAKVRRILARHGWFQTVASDKPHFTYLGVAESELPQLGLYSVQIDGQIFWIPRSTEKQ